MGFQVRCHKKKRALPISATEKIDSSVCYPVCRMSFLRINPRSGDPTIALQACICYICIHTALISQPVKIVICLTLRFSIGNFTVSIGVQIPVVELHIVKSQIIPQRMYVHLSYALGIVPGLGQFAGNGMLILPRNIVFIPYPSMMFRCQTCMKGCSGCNTTGTSTIGVFKHYSATGKSIQKGSFYIGMACSSQTVSPKLICHY